MLSTFRSVLIPLFTGLAILAVVGLLGSALILFREASAVHPGLGWAVAALLVTALVLLIVIPVIQLLRLPRALVRPTTTSGKEWDRYVERFSRRMLKNPRLEDFEGRPDLERALAHPGSERLERAAIKAVEFLDAQAESVVRRHAAVVFSSTAISQSGRLDTAIVLSTQVRMIREVAEIYVQRPTWRELWKLYANVGTSGFIAGEIQDSELLAVMGAPVTAGITSFIPLAGADPLVSLLVNSLMDGSANAFLTLRLGVLAQRHSGLRPVSDRKRMARSASLTAAGLLGAVVSQGANRVAGLTRKLVVGRAARGTSKAAKGVAGAGQGLFDKIAGLAGRAGSAAVDSTTSGVRFLQESLRFWETVATAPLEQEEAATEVPDSSAPPAARS